MEQVPTQHDPIEPERSRRAALVAVALVALAAVAAGAYFAGRAAADSAGAARRGYLRGQAAGAGEYRPGLPRYTRIFQRGFGAGRAAGVKEGMRQGELIGAEKGRKAALDQGATDIGELQADAGVITAASRAALGGYASWQTDSFYIVRMDDGEQGVPYRVQARFEMQTDERYAVCADKATEICLKPIPKR